MQILCFVKIFPNKLISRWDRKKKMHKDESIDIFDNKGWQYLLQKDFVLMAYYISRSDKVCMIANWK